MKALTILLLVTGLASGSATGGWERDEVLAGLPEKAWPHSITQLDDNVTQFDDNLTQLQPRITDVDSRTTDQGEQVIALSSDILFEFDRAGITSAAETKISELVAEVPDGASVRVHGHTDSLGTAERNAELSLERAETVAAVIEAVRPDLELEVEGFGPDQPVEPNEVNGEDNPEGRALNRRVEIRYDG